MAVVGNCPSLCIEQVLLATDFSEVATVAESYARALAHRFGSTVTVAHVFDPAKNSTYEGGVLAPLNIDRLKMRSEKLSVLGEKLRRDGIHSKSVLREGHPASEELLSVIEEEGADLVVLGTHSKGTLERFVLGSTAEGLIRKTNRPVLTVGPCVKPIRSEQVDFRNIVYATDFSSQAAKATVFALSFAEDSGGHLYFCHVVDEAQNLLPLQATIDSYFLSELKRMVPESSYDWCSPEVVVEHGDAGAAILELAKRVHADLIVLGPRKPSFMLTHLERGVTLEVLAEAECPVLTVC